MTWLDTSFRLERGSRPLSWCCLRGRKRTRHFQSASWLVARLVSAWKCLRWRRARLQNWRETIARSGHVGPRCGGAYARLRGVVAGATTVSLQASDYLAPCTSMEDAKIYSRGDQATHHWYSVPNASTDLHGCLSGAKARIACMFALQGARPRIVCRIDPSAPILEGSRGQLDNQGN